MIQIQSRLNLVYSFKNINKVIKFLVWIKFKGKSRTVINKSESNVAAQPLGPASTVGNDQEAFMKALEFDANERHKRKQENLKISNDLKEKGNVEYQNKNFEKAIQFYTEVKLI